MELPNIFQKFSKRQIFLMELLRNSERNGIFFSEIFSAILENFFENFKCIFQTFSLLFRCKFVQKFLWNSFCYAFENFFEIAPVIPLYFLFLCIPPKTVSAFSCRDSFDSFLGKLFGKFFKNVFVNKQLKKNTASPSKIASAFYL